MAEDEDKEDFGHSLFTLDLTGQNAFCDFYLSLVPDIKLIRLFLRTKSASGSSSSPFYTVHGDNCKFLAREYIKTEQCIQYLGLQKLPSCVVNGKLFEEIIRSLWKTMKFEVWQNMASSGSSTNNAKWEIVKKSSPGNMEAFDDLLFRNSSSSKNDSLEGGNGECSVVMAVVHREEACGRVLIGCAFCNTSLHLLGVTEFVDGDHFSSLESFLVQISAKECLLPKATMTVSKKKKRKLRNETTTTTSTEMATNSTTTVEEEDDEEEAQQIASEHSQTSLIRDVLRRSGVLVTEVKRSDFSGKDVAAKLQSVLREDSVITDELQLTDAVCALGAILNILGISAPTSSSSSSCDNVDHHHKYRLKKVNLTKYMRMDSAAVSALQLFPAAGVGASSSSDTSRGSSHSNNSNSSNDSSLFGFLNSKCCTLMGSRLLRQWITQPLLDISEIEQRQNVVEILISNNMLRKALREDILKRMPDLDSLIRRLVKQSSSLPDLVLLSKLLDLAPLLRDLLLRYSSSSTGGEHCVEVLHLSSYVLSLNEICGHLSGLKTLINSTVDMSSSPGEVTIVSSFDQDLEDLSTKRKNIDSRIDACFKSALIELATDAKTVKLERSQASGGFHMRITRQKDGILRSSKKFHIIETRKDGVRFTSDKLLGLNRERREVVDAYDARSASLVEKLLQTVTTYLPVIEDAKECITSLDILSSFATVTVEAPTAFQRPKILPMSEHHFVVVAGRHPMLEAQDGVRFVPNNIDLTSNKSFAIITGPNMGGKSTYIRMAGVLQLMAQLGMFLPCESATISIRDFILARVGATDYQSRGISTFMAEMLETATILENASENALIIMDELGRGTSTNDGFGLAWAITAHIASKARSACLFATHFHELTKITDEFDNIFNLHVTADTSKDDLVMLYGVQTGACPKSFGIRVAELACFPSCVVTAAKRKALELESFNNNSSSSSNDNDDLRSAKKHKESTQPDVSSITANDHYSDSHNKNNNNNDNNNNNNILNNDLLLSQSSVILNTNSTTTTTTVDDVIACSNSCETSVSSTKSECNNKSSSVLLNSFINLRQEYFDYYQNQRKESSDLETEQHIQTMKEKLQRLVHEIDECVPV